MNNLLNIKSFLKFLSRNKGYTAIDVFGLSVSLMFVILIAVYEERDLNIDNSEEYTNFFWSQDVDCRSRICGFDVFRPLFVLDTRWRPRPAFGRSL